MARGWESKSVEAQQAEAGEARPAAKPRLTREEALRLRERENLRLARQHVLEQLKRSPSAPLTEMLMAAVREIESKLASLAAPGSAERSGH